MIRAVCTGGREAWEERGASGLGSPESQPNRRLSVAEDAQARSAAAVTRGQVANFINNFRVEGLTLLGKPVGKRVLG